MSSVKYMKEIEGSVSIRECLRPIKFRLANRLTSDRKLALEGVRMNVILFETEELSKPLNIRDHRAKHILKVLRLNPGETFKMGVINGKMGEGIFIGVDEQQLNFSFELKYMPKVYTRLH